MTEETKVTAFKGFDKDMKCRGFQYEVGKTYTQDKPVKICESGFHACENPFDVWTYYGPTDATYAEVILAGDMQKEQGSDSKICAAHISIVAEISAGDFARKCVDWIISATKGKSTSGNYARIGSSGNYARIGSSGYGARIGSSGYGAQIGSSGYGARIGSSGNGAQIEATGENSITAAAGYVQKWRGGNGAWFALPDFRNDVMHGFVTGCVGENGVKPNVWYCVRDGKLVEVA